MKPNFKYLATVALLCVLLSVRLAYAQKNSVERYDIYYLSVGSGHYISPGKDRLEAINSAKTMASIFQELGGKGYELLSKTDAENGKIYPVTNIHVLNEIAKLKNDIIHDKPKNPLIVFYYMGHGVGDKDGNQYIASGDYDFKIRELREADDNVGVFRVTNLASEFNSLNINKNDSNYVLNDSEIGVFKNIRDIVHSKNPDHPFKMIEDLQKPMEDLCALHKEKLGKPSIDCNTVTVNVNGERLDVSKLKDLDIKKPEDREKILDQIGQNNKLVALTKKLHGRSIQELSDEEMSELRSELLDEKSMSIYKDVMSMSEAELYARMMSKVELPDGESTMDMKAFIDNIPVKMKKAYNNAPQGVDQPFTPMTPEQIKREQKEARLQARRELDDVKPMLIPTEKHPHVPYLVIIDSCSSGVQGMSDKALETSINAYTHNNAIKEKLEGTLTKEQAEKLASANTMVFQNYAIQTAGFSQIGFAEMTGGVFKEHGALFFAADPGELSHAFDQGEAAFIKDEHRIGRLAKRFELAVNEASSSGRDVSLGEFAQMFSSERTEGLQEGEAGLPKPFSWFKVPASLSQNILIEGKH